MEEKLRNLSQNIAANTGDEHKPKQHHPEDDAPKEEAPVEEPPKEEEHHEEPQEEHHEPEKHEDVTPWEDEAEEEAPVEEPSDYAPEPEQQQEEEHQEEEHHDEESEPEKIEVKKEEPKEPEGPKILTMETEDEEEVPAESPTRTKKYSPEVEAALNRLNAEDAAVDLSEPLSTEPKKKHHAGRIFLFILFLLAAAAVTLCVLVEKNIIDNPFPDLFGKKSEAADAVVVEQPEKEVALTDTKVIAEVDTLFNEVHKDSTNFYIFAKSYQNTHYNEFVYYDVAEPKTTTEGQTTDCAGEESTDCATVAVTADNYQNFSHYRYVFEKTDLGPYEFYEKRPLMNQKEYEDAVKALNEKTSNSENK